MNTQEEAKRSIDRSNLLFQLPLAVPLLLLPIFTYLCSYLIYVTLPPDTSRVHPSGVVRISPVERDELQTAGGR